MGFLCDANTSLSAESLYALLANNDKEKQMLLNTNCCVVKAKRHEGSLLSIFFFDFH